MNRESLIKQRDELIDAIHAVEVEIESLNLDLELNRDELTDIEIQIAELDDAADNEEVEAI